MSCRLANTHIYLGQSLASQACERLTQLVLADAAVAEALLRQLLTTAGVADRAEGNAATFRLGFKDCLDRVIAIKVWPCLTR